MGQDIHQLTENQLIDFRARKLGFIFQQFNLLPALNAAENAAIPLLIQGIRMEAAVKRAEDLLERLQMGPHVRKYPNQLSGGQQQRVAIARSLIHQPQLLICDEPTASLDSESGQAVMELLRDLANAPDRAVLVVTHDNRIFSFADTIAHISDGRITRIESKTGT
jgi:putative ABC transport system ATP-binding protein